MALLDEILDRHGGLERWRAVKSIRASVRTGGLLPGSRFRRAWERSYDIVVDTSLQHVVLDPFPVPGQRGVLADGCVRVEADDGEVVAQRDDPRAAFFGASGVRRNLRWDALDATYFAGYAFWNYLTTPLLLANPEVEVAEGPDWTAGGTRWRRLEVGFARSGVHTHSPRQVFYADGDGLLRRHDYTAEVVGRWAKAAHLMEGHREFGGLWFPTSRRVRPSGFRNRPLRAPTLVSIDIDEVTVENR